MDFWFVFFIGTLTVLSINTLAFSPLTMEEGEWRTIGVGTQSYNIDVLIIEDTTPATVTFKINGQITPELVDGATYQLSGAVLQVIEIILVEAGEAGSGDLVAISFSQYCGDKVCDAGETCGGCVVDCGCEYGNYCHKGKVCEKIVCGDDICSDGETCEDDNCCWGKTVTDFGTKYNCGLCGTRCGYHEDCVDGACKQQPYCGDFICQDGEECVWDCADQRDGKNVGEEKDIDEILSSLRVYKEKNAIKIEETAAEEPKNEIAEQEQSNEATSEPQKEETSILQRFISWLGRVFEEE